MVLANLGTHMQMNEDTNFQHVQKLAQSSDPMELIEKN